MMALDEYNRLWSWGSGSYGELGNGNFNDSFIPVQVQAITNDKIK